MILEIENALLALLQPVGQSQNAKVEALPEDWAKIGGKPHQFTQIWVRYNGSNISGTTMRTSEVNFAVDISAKQLRGHKSVYAVIEAVIAALDGQLYANKPIKILSVSELTFKDTWQCTVIVAIIAYTRGACQI